MQLKNQKRIKEEFHQTIIDNASKVQAKMRENVLIKLGRNHQFRGMIKENPSGAPEEIDFTLLD